jgi:hypothetical protein
MADYEELRLWRNDKDTRSNHGVTYLMLIAGRRASYKTITPKSALLQPYDPFQSLRPADRKRISIPRKARYVRGGLRPVRAAFTEPLVYAFLIWEQYAVTFTLPPQRGWYHLHSENEDDLNTSHTNDLDRTSSSRILLILEE